jgi:hypothetical protein
MRKHLVVFLAIMISTFLGAYQWLTQEQVNLYNKDIMIQPFAMTIYNRTYSVEKRWKTSPKITFKWYSQTGLEEQVENILLDAGFYVDEAGFEFSGKIQYINDKFIYWEFSYLGKTANNAESLLKKTESFEPNVSLFLNEAYALDSERLTTLNTPLEYLVYFRSHYQYTMNGIDDSARGILLLEGDGFSIWKFFSRSIRLTQSTKKVLGHGETVLEINLLQLPVQMIDLEDASFQYILRTLPYSIKVVVDDIEYQTPVEIELSQGVHRLRYLNTERFFYLSENTEQVITVENPRGMIAIKTDIPARITITSPGGFFERYEDTKEIEITLPIGDYSCEIYREAYEMINESVTVLPGDSKKIEFIMKPKPGSVYWRQNLTKEYESILLNENWVILSSGNTSEFYPLPSSDASPFYLDTVIRDVETHYAVTDMEVYSENTTLYTSEYPIIGVKHIQDGLWVFDASGTLTVLQATSGKTQWRRNLEYIPFQMVRYGKWLAILDIYGNFYLLEPGRGYWEVFRYRIGSRSTISFLEEATNMLEVFFSSGSIVTYSFTTKAYHVQENASFQKQLIESASDGLYWLGERFYTFETEPTAWFIAPDTIGVLYPDSFHLIFRPDL